jgi:alpha-glucosidase
MYEDDGMTREQRKRAFANTWFEVNAGKMLQLDINPALGNYNGKYLNRNLLELCLIINR